MWTFFSFQDSDLNKLNEKKKKPKQISMRQSWKLEHNF